MRGGERWLNGAVLGIGLASLLSDLGHEMATAILPAFLAAIGGTPAALGIIEGVADGLSAWVKLFAGHIADRPAARRPVGIAGYAATGIATGMFALATAWWHVLVARSLGWMARGVRGPSRDALLTEAVPAAARGRAFGFERGMDTLGAVLGPAAAFFLATRLDARTIFALAAIPGVLAAVAFATLVRAGRERPHQARRGLFASLATLPPGFRRYLAAIFIFGAGDFSHTLLILRASEVLAPERGAAAAGATAIGLYVAHNLVQALASYPVGYAADVVGKRPLLVAGYALGAAVAAGFALGPTSLLAVGGLFVAGGVVLAVEETLERSLAADLAPAEARGTGFGALAAVNGLGDLVSSAALGVLWASGGARIGFAFSAALCLAGAAVLAAARLDEPAA